MSGNGYEGTSPDGRQFRFEKNHHVPQLPNVFQWMATDLRSGSQHQAEQKESLGVFDIRELGLRIPVTERNS